MHSMKPPLPNEVNNPPRKRKKLDLKTLGRSIKPESVAAAAAPEIGKLGGEPAESSKTSDIDTVKQEASSDKAGVGDRAEREAELGSGRRNVFVYHQDPQTAHPGLDCADGNRKGDDERNKKKGKFSRSETAIIVDAVKAYAEANDLSVEHLCTKRKGLRGAWSTIAECLPDRTLKAVYRHAQRQLHSLKRGPWTANELSTLLYLVKRNGKKWKFIEQELGRVAETCRDKYRELLVEPTKGLWTDEEEKRLVEIIEGKRRHSGGHKKINMEWDDVAKQMGTRSRIACMKKWSYMQEKRDIDQFVRFKDSDLSLKLSFAKEVLKTGAQDETELIWTQLPARRPQRFWKNLRKGLPRTMPLQEATKVIIERLESEMSGKASNDSITAKPKTPLRTGRTKYSSRPSPTGLLNKVDTGSEIQAEVDSENGDASPRLSNNATCENPVATGAEDFEDEDQITQKHGLTNGGERVKGRSDDKEKGEEDILSEDDRIEKKKRKKMKKDKKKRKREEAEGKKRSQVDTGSEIQAERNSETGDASPRLSNNATCENPVATGAEDFEDEDQITQKHGLTNGREIVEGRSDDKEKGEKEVLSEDDRIEKKKRKKMKKEKKKRKREEAEGKKRSQVDTGSEIQAEVDSENGDASPRLSNNATCENPVATGAEDFEDEDQITQKRGLTNGRERVKGRSDDEEKGEKDILSEDDRIEKKKRKKMKKDKKKRKREEAESKKS